MASGYGQMPDPTQGALQGGGQGDGDHTGVPDASTPGMQTFNPSQFISFSDVPVDVRTPEQKEAERQERERKRQREEAQQKRAEEERRRQEEAERRRQAYQQAYQNDDLPPDGDGVYENGENYGHTLADTIQWPSELQVDWPAWNDENLTQVAHGKASAAQDGHGESPADAASDQFVGSSPQSWQSTGAPIPTSEMPAIFTAGGLDPYSGMEGMDDPEPAPRKKDGEDKKTSHKPKKESFWDRRRREKEEKEAQQKAEEERKKAEEERKRQAIENGAESQMMWGF